MVTWEQLYDLLGVREFIYFISSPSIQDQLFGVKLVFIFFAGFFFCAVIYFYLNSSYLHYQFLQDVTEFFSWQAYGLIEVNKQWKKIIKKTASGLENDYKLAIIEADEFLHRTLEGRDLAGDTFEELVNSAGKRLLPDFEVILEAHAVRNSIVYNQSYTLETESAKKILADYERAIKNISTG